MGTAAGVTGTVLVVVVVVVDMGVDVDVKEGTDAQR